MNGSNLQALQLNDRLTDGDADTALEAVVNRIVDQSTSLHSLMVISIDNDGNDTIECVGDLEGLRTLAALAVQQLTVQLLQRDSQPH